MVKVSLADFDGKLQEKIPLFLQKHNEYLFKFTHKINNEVLLFILTYLNLEKARSKLSGPWHLIVIQDPGLKNLYFQ